MQRGNLTRYCTKLGIMTVSCTDFRLLLFEDLCPLRCYVVTYNSEEGGSSTLRRGIKKRTILELGLTLKTEALWSSTMAKGRKILESLLTLLRGPQILHFFSLH